MVIVILSNLIKFIKNVRIQMYCLANSLIFMNLSFPVDDEVYDQTLDIMLVKLAEVRLNVI